MPTPNCPAYHSVSGSFLLTFDRKKVRILRPAILHSIRFKSITVIVGYCFNSVGYVVSCNLILTNFVNYNEILKMSKDTKNYDVQAKISKIAMKT